MAEENTVWKGLEARGRKQSGLGECVFCDLMPVRSRKEGFKPRRQQRARFTAESLGWRCKNTALASKLGKQNWEAPNPNHIQSHVTNVSCQHFRKKQNKTAPTQRYVPISLLNWHYLCEFFLFICFWFTFYHPTFLFASRIQHFISVQSLFSIHSVFSKIQVSFVSLFK